jgi:hypothetical protein
MMAGVRAVSGRYKESVRTSSSSFLVAFVVAGVTIASAAASPSATSAVRLRIYDPAGQSKVVVTIADVVRSSIRATRQPDGSGVVSFRLTGSGAGKFHRLTLALAQRGSRLHRSQHLAMQIGAFMSKPLIDYRASPDGLDGRDPNLLLVPKFSMAQRMARIMRGG